MRTVNLADVLIAVSRSAPEATALKDDEECLSFGQMIDRAARTRAVLAGLGIRAGDRVGVAGHRDLENIVIYIALWLMNAVAVPIDFRSRRGERARHAETFQLKAIVESRTATGAGDYRQILLDEDWRRGVAKAEPEFERPGASDHPAFIALTSGTTGLPRGVVQSHESFYLRYKNFRTAETVPNAGGRYLNLFPMSSAAARALSLYSLLDGTTIQFHAPLFDTGEVIETIKRDRITATWVIPQLLQDFLARSAPPYPIFPDLDFLACGGAPLGPEEKKLARRRLSPNFIEFFAASSAGTVSALTGDDLETNPLSVGRPLPHVLVEIVDRDNRPLAIGETGRLRVRAPGMVNEIIRNSAVEDVSEEEIVEGWAYTGDLAMLSEDGFLTICGRASDMIIQSGANVFPREIETLLIQHEAVTDVSVVGVPSREYGEKVVALVVAESGVDVSELHAVARRELPPNKRPKVIGLVDRIPRSELGKVKKSALLELAAALAGEATQ